MNLQLVYDIFNSIRSIIRKNNEIKIYKKKYKLDDNNFIRVFSPKRINLRKLSDLVVSLFLLVFIILVLRYFLSVEQGSKAATIENIPAIENGAVEFLYWVVVLFIFVVSVILIIAYFLRRLLYSIIIRSFATLVITFVVAYCINMFLILPQKGEVWESLEMITITGNKISTFGIFFAPYIAFLVVATRKLPIKYIANICIAPFVLSIFEILIHATTFSGLLISILFGISFGSFSNFIFGNSSEIVTEKNICNFLLEKNITPKYLFRIPWENQYDYIDIHDDATILKYYKKRKFIASDFKSNEWVIFSTNNKRYEVSVLSNEQQIGTFFSNVIRAITTKGISYVSATNIKSQVERVLLTTNTAKSVGINTDNYIGYKYLEPYIFLLSKQKIGVERLGHYNNGEISHEMMKSIFKQLKKAHDFGLSNGMIIERNLLFDTKKNFHMVDWWMGNIMATNNEKKIDIAQTLILLTLLKNQNFKYNKKKHQKPAINTTAIDAFINIYGTQSIVAVLPFLQFDVLPHNTKVFFKNRKVQSKHKARNSSIINVIIKLIKDALYTKLPAEKVDEIKPIVIKRWTWKNIVILGVFSLIIYAFIKNIKLKDISDALLIANKNYLLIALGFVILTAVGGAISFKSFALVNIGFLEVFINQIATFFVAVIAPGGVGFAATQVKLMVKHNQEKVSAIATSVFIQIFLGLSSTILLVIASLCTVKEGNTFSFIKTLIIIIIIIFIFFLAWKIKTTNKLIKKYIMPTIDKIKPIYNSIKQSPIKLLTGLLGNFIQTISYIIALVCVIWSFNYRLDSFGINFFSVAVVYIVSFMSGAIIPTPGGVGAVELALIFGLTSFGINPTHSMLIVLLFRIISYWMMIIIGFIAYKVVYSDTLFKVKKFSDEKTVKKIFTKKET